MVVVHHARLLPGPELLMIACITSATAANIVEGQGFVYNLGNPVARYNHPLLHLLMAAISALLIQARLSMGYAIIVSALARCAHLRTALLLARRLREPILVVCHPDCMGDFPASVTFLCGWHGKAASPILWMVAATAA